MKTALLALMVLILIALFTGLFFLMKEEGNSKKTLRALIVRVGLSLVLIFFITLSFYMGWIVPHPVGG